MGADSIILREEVIDPEVAFMPRQLAGETDAWYYKFLKYFLTAGAGRSVAGAYREYCKSEHPERLDDNGKVDTPRVWAAMAKQYGWRERASEYDRQYATLTVDSVALAIEILRDAAPDAALALVSSLENPKYRVAASREILDRVGVPRKTVQETVTMKITPDDLRRAREEAEDWEKKTFEANG
jgi:hypothetical protein